MQLAASSQFTNGPGGRERRRSALKESERDRRIRMVGLLYLTGWPLAEICRAAQCTPRTLHRWRRELLADGEADTEALRRLEVSRN